jgi:pSer/pThr/pTyr-binding forkhead associated (FHA) protein
MNDLTFSILRILYLIGLWLFVVFTILLIRKDIFTSKIRVKDKKHSDNKNNVNSLEILAGPLKGTVIPLTDAEIIIGRDPRNTIVINDDHLSARHAALRKQNERWYIEDLESRNGTVLNNKPVNAPVEIFRGAKAKLGKTVIRFVK